MTAKPWDLRRTLKDFAWSAGGVLVLLTLLVVFDARVREEVTLAAHGLRPSSEFAAAQTEARSVASVVVASAKQQARLHTPMMVFVFASTVLTLFMVRT